MWIIRLHGARALDGHVDGSKNGAYFEVGEARRRMELRFVESRFLCLFSRKIVRCIIEMLKS